MNLINIDRKLFVYWTGAFIFAAITTDARAQIIAAGEAGAAGRPGAAAESAAGTPSTRASSPVFPIFDLRIPMPAAPPPAALSFQRTPGQDSSAGRAGLTDFFTDLRIPMPESSAAKLSAAASDAATSLPAADAAAPTTRTLPALEADAKAGSPAGYVAQPGEASAREGARARISEIIARGLSYFAPAAAERGTVPTFTPQLPALKKYQAPEPNASSRPSLSLPTFTGARWDDPQAVIAHSFSSLSGSYDGVRFESARADLSDGKAVGWTLRFQGQARGLKNVFSRRRLLTVRLDAHEAQATETATPAGAAKKAVRYLEAASLRSLALRFDLIDTALREIAPHYPDVRFDSVEVKTEQAILWPYWGVEKAVDYPVYVFKGRLIADPTVTMSTEWRRPNIHSFNGRLNLLSSYFRSPIKADPKGWAWATLILHTYDEDEDSGPSLQFIARKLPNLLQSYRMETVSPFLQTSNPINQSNVLVSQFEHTVSLRVKLPVSEYERLRAGVDSSAGLNAAIRLDYFAPQRRAE
jgi:hypothetical protein